MVRRRRVTAYANRVTRVTDCFDIFANFVTSRRRRDLLARSRFMRRCRQAMLRQRRTGGRARRELRAKCLFGIGNWAILLRFVFAHPRFFEE